MLMSRKPNVQKTVLELRAQMQEEIEHYNGRRIDDRLTLELYAFLEKWRRRIDPLVSGIRFTSSFEGGHLQISSYIEAPQYVLVIHHA